MVGLTEAKWPLSENLASQNGAICLRPSSLNNVKKIEICLVSNIYCSYCHTADGADMGVPRT